MTDPLMLALTFFGGLLVGLVVAVVLLPRFKGSQIQDQQEKHEQQLKQQQQTLDEHFLRTAELMNKLSVSYRDMTEYLADSAHQLCSEDGLRLVHSKSLEPLINSDTKPLSPPLDYAPSHKGTLAENYGLEQAEKESQELSESSAQGQSQAPRDYAEGCEEQGCPPKSEQA